MRVDQKRSSHLYPNSGQICKRSYLIGQMNSLSSDSHVKGKIRHKEATTNQWINLVGITAKVLHSIPHCSQINHSWHSSKILKTKNQAQEISSHMTHWNFKDQARIKPQTCKRTREGLKGISTCFGALFSQSMIFSTSSLVTWKPSQLRIADSNKIRME